MNYLRPMLKRKNSFFDVKLHCKVCGREQVSTLASCLKNWPHCSKTPMSIVWIDTNCDIESAINFAIARGRVWFELLLADNQLSGLEAFAKGDHKECCPLGLNCSGMLQQLGMKPTACDNFKQCLQLHAEVEEQPYDIVFDA